MLSDPGPAQLGSSLAQARFLEICNSGDLEIQKVGIQKIGKIEILKIQIRSAQNVGKVWISREKTSWPHLGPSHAIFSMDRKNQKHAQNLPIFLGGPMGPIQPVWGHMLVSFESFLTCS